MLEVVFRRDGETVISIAHYSYRCGPLGEWSVGDTPLAQLDVVCTRQLPDALDTHLTEATPEMIEAGVDAYIECDREFDPSAQIVAQVFAAMMRSARRVP